MWLGAGIGAYRHVSTYRRGRVSVDSVAACEETVGERRRRAREAQGRHMESERTDRPSAGPSVACRDSETAREAQAAAHGQAAQRTSEVADVGRGRPTRREQ